MSEFYTEADAWRRSPGLQPVVISKELKLLPDDLPPPPKSDSGSDSSGTSTRWKRKPKKKRFQPSQGDVVLIGYMDPNRPDIARRAGHQTFSSSSEDQTDPSDEDQDMSDENLDQDDGASEDDKPVANMQISIENPSPKLTNKPTSARSTPVLSADSRGSFVETTVAKAPLASQSGNDATNHQATPYFVDTDRKTSGPSTRSRSKQDQAHDDTRQGQAQRGTCSPPSSGLIRRVPTNPHTAKKAPNVNEFQSSGVETMVTSPKLLQHVIPPASRSPGQMLPAIQPESPVAQIQHGLLEQQLPSVVKGLINGIAPGDDAVSCNTRPRAASLSSTNATLVFSPTMLTRPFPTSPLRNSRPSTCNTPSVIYSDQSLSDHVSVVSPSISVPSPVDTPVNFSRYRPSNSIPQFPSLVKSTSSSSASHPSTGSSSEGLTPASHPTLGDPISSQTEIRRRPLPSAKREATIRLPVNQSGLYHCNVEGCTAPPFHTQYLLSSHANVHSDQRPHYCPFKHCRHAEGGSGQGFKRKNEMKRHQLVHQPPSYVCPFCPDRDHRYPRRDNLQRHIRQHHAGKSKDDPALLDVPCQRVADQGSGVKGKKRPHRT